MPDPMNAEHSSFRLTILVLAVELCMTLDVETLDVSTKPEFGRAVIQADGFALYTPSVKAFAGSSVCV